MEKLKLYMEQESKRLNGAVEHLAELIKDKAWQDKDLQMTKAEVMAEYHVYLGRQRQIVDVLSEMEYQMEVSK